MTTQQALDWMNGGWQASKYCKTIAGIGKGIDVDNVFGFQCKDFANGYAEFMGAPFSFGNAIVLWDVPQPGWHKVSTPQVGDVFVKDYVSGGVNYGDTGLVKAIEGSNVRVVQQNLAANLYFGSPPAERVVAQSQMLGYLRNDNIGEDMQPTPKQAGDVYRFMTNAEISQKDLDFYITAPQTIYDMIYALGPDTQAKVKEANEGGAEYEAAPTLYVKKG